MGRGGAPPPRTPPRDCKGSVSWRDGLLAGRCDRGGHTEKDAILDVGDVCERRDECGTGFGIGLAVGRTGQVVGDLEDVQA